MTKYEIQALLEQSFDDFRLDNDERRELAGQLAVAELKGDDLSFLRNQSFALVLQILREGRDGEQALKWLEQVIKQLDKVRGRDCEGVAESWFSPGNSCLNGIRNQLEKATRTVDICVFTIADDQLSAAILAAHQRGVKVRIITDNDKVNDAGSDIDHLARQGIEVKIDNTSYHMHHKFALFDNTRLINGSFNWTRSASRFNTEDLTLTEDRRHIQAFSCKFEQLWRYFPNYK